MGRSMIVALGLTAIALLSFWCAHSHRESIEADLVERASSGLSEAGLGHLQVAAAGRDLTVSGAAASPDVRGRA
ncbi:MAG: hypothetical protein AAGF23_12080, partial [Acidobacteriota bacterium]